MALTDYAQKRKERVFARSQAAVGVFTMPTERDAVKLRGGAVLPATGSEFAPSEEVRDTPDTDQLLKRKKPPAEFTLTTYAKVPTVAGIVPQWHALMDNSYGRSGFAVAIVGDPTGVTVTVKVDNVPTIVTLPPGGDADACADAINAASPDLDAFVVGGAVIVGTKPGAGQLAVTIDPPDSTAVTVGPMTYFLHSAPPPDITERLLTIVHFTDNGCDYYRDCIVSNVIVRAEGTTEASLVFSGLLGNSTSVYQTRLAAAIAGGHDDETPIAFTLEDPAVQLGPTPEDVAWFTVNGEAYRVVDFDPDTKSGHAIGGQFGTTVAPGAIGDEVFPYIPGPDPDANDHIIGLTIGEFKIDGTAHRIINVEAAKDERINPRIDEAFESALTGYRRPLEGRSVGGTVTAYQRRAILALATYSEREKESLATLRLGTVDGPRIVVTWPRFRLGRVEKGEQGGEFTRSFPFQGMASGTPGNDGISLAVYPGAA